MMVSHGPALNDASPDAPDETAVEAVRAIDATRAGVRVAGSDAPEKNRSQGRFYSADRLRLHHHGIGHGI
jgi:hypothetical protein